LEILKRREPDQEHNAQVEKRWQEEEEVQLGAT
jgi:hypothetical protein